MEIKNTAIGSTTGANWIRANVMAPGSRNYATNVNDIQLAPDRSPSAVRMIYADGTSGVLSLPSSDAAQQAVQAWKTLTGQAGAATPTDPISASISNLTNMSAAGEKVSSAAQDLATKTGMPVWLVIGAMVFAAIWLLPKVWRFIKTKIFKRR